MDLAASPAAPETLSFPLVAVLHGVLQALRVWRLEPVLAVLLFRRVSHLAARMERMIVRFRAGRLWRRGPLRAVAGRSLAPSAPGPRLPGRFGWLVEICGSEAACMGSQLRCVLDRPEMAELLAVSAQARRLVRPMCRALAVELPWVTDAECAQDRPEKHLTIRKRVARSAPEPFRIPLPRGVLSAARRAGFGRDVLPAGNTAP